MPNGKRDTYRSRVYAAERAALDAPDLPRYKTLADAQAYVDKLVKSAWFKRRWPDVRWIELRPGKGHRRATADPDYIRGGVIQLPLWARKEWVVLHEVAHICVGRLEGAWHSQPFLKAYIELVGHQQGKWAGDALKLELRARRVPTRQRRAAT